MSAPDIKKLYQDTIIALNRQPHNYRVMENATKVHEAYNPVCGDHLTVYIRRDDNNMIHDISFHGDGCAISRASASMMTDVLLGKTCDTAYTLCHDFIAFMENVEETTSLHEDLAIFEAVRDYPNRITCATLVWNAAKKILAHY